MTRPPARRRLRRLAVVAAVAVGVTTAAAAAQAGGAGQPSRPRAPETLDCPRDSLTSYTGEVVDYARRLGGTTLRIRTDWGTTEAVTVPHPGTDDPSAAFHIDGRPFTAADWPRIERDHGRLRERMRATAWVCATGRLRVDWDVPREGSGPERERAPAADH